MKLHSFGSLMGPTDRERGNLSGGEVESHFLPLEIPLLLSMDTGINGYLYLHIQHSVMVSSVFTLL